MHRIVLKWERIGQCRITSSSEDNNASEYSYGVPLLSLLLDTHKRDSDDDELIRNSFLQFHIDKLASTDLSASRLIGISQAV